MWDIILRPSKVGELAHLSSSERNAIVLFFTKIEFFVLPAITKTMFYNMCPQRLRHRMLVRALPFKDSEYTFLHGGGSVDKGNRTLENVGLNHTRRPTSATSTF